MSKTTRKPRSRAKPAASIPPFLHKIYEILENPSHHDLISWNQEGNAFIIKNVTEFTENVLPKYFKHNNFASFVRQLNLYDFHKSRYENNGSEFYHKLFKRDEKHLLLEIKRKMPNENGSDSPSQFFQQEEVVPESYSSSSFQCSSTLQDIINRQERLESAMKIVHTQNKHLLKENKMLWNEVTALKNKQGNTEKVTRTLNGQNSQLIQKNSYLWNEMIMNRERYERKVEKLMIFLISILQGQGKNTFQLFKKKNAPPRNAAGEEENSFENMRPANTENNNFSVLPVKQIIKHFGNKKGKSQLDKLLERLDEENLANLFGNKSLSLEDKDCLLKLSSLFEVEAGNVNFSGFDFLADKRPHQINRSFEEENPRDGSSKLCKLEYEDPDSALLLDNEDKNKKEFPGFKTSLFDKFIRDEKPNDISSPMRIEDEFEMLSFQPKEGNSMEYDFLSGLDKPLVPFHKNNSIFPNHFSEDEGDNEEEVKKDSSFMSNKSLHKSLSASFLDFHTKNDQKLDDVFRMFSPSNFLNNNNFNQEHDNQDNFFSSSINKMNLDTST